MRRSVLFKWDSLHRGARGQSTSECDLGEKLAITSTSSDDEKPDARES